jgi:hypothetical protein
MMAEMKRRGEEEKFEMGRIYRPLIAGVNILGLPAALRPATADISWR